MLCFKQRYQVSNEFPHHKTKIPGILYKQPKYGYLSVMCVSIFHLSLRSLCKALEHFRSLQEVCRMTFKGRRPSMEDDLRHIIRITRHITQHIIRHLPDTLKTPYRHPPDTQQTPSRQFPYILRTPTRKSPKFRHVGSILLLEAR